MTLSYPSYYFNTLASYQKQAAASRTELQLIIKVVKHVYMNIWIMNLFTFVKCVLLFTHSVTKGNKRNSFFYFEILNTVMKALSQVYYQWLSFFYVCLIVDGTTVQTEEMNSKDGYQVKSKPLWHCGFWKSTTRGAVDFPEVGQPASKNHDGLSRKCLVFLLFLRWTSAWLFSWVD